MKLSFQLSLTLPNEVSMEVSHRSFKGLRNAHSYVAWISTTPLGPNTKLGPVVSGIEEPHRKV